jgi:hypothetical protein
LGRRHQHAIEVLVGGLDPPARADAEVVVVALPGGRAHGALAERPDAAHADAIPGGLDEHLGGPGAAVRPVHDRQVGAREPEGHAVDDQLVTARAHEGARCAIARRPTAGRVRAPGDRLAPAGRARGACPATARTTHVAPCARVRPVNVGRAGLGHQHDGGQGQPAGHPHAALRAGAGVICP